MVSKPSRSVKQTVPLVRIHLAPPPSPYLWRYLARITEKPAPAASFANMWSRRKSLSGSDGQFAAKISVGKFGATVWAGRGMELSVDNSRGGNRDRAATPNSRHQP